MRRVRASIGAAVLALVLSAAGTGSARADVVWDITADWAPTTLLPGEDGQFVVHSGNLGSTAASGVVTLKLYLPTGVTATHFNQDPADPAPTQRWKCFGTQVVTCVDSITGTEKGTVADETMTSVIRSKLARLYVNVAVAPGASGIRTSTATISGAGGATASDTNQIRIAPEATNFGVIPESFEKTSDVYGVKYPATSPARQAGSHPYELRVNFDMKLKYGLDPEEGFPYTSPVNRVRTVEATLPRGFIGNPEAVPRCSTNDFLQGGSEQYNTTGCPANTQVGYMDLALNFGTGFHGYSIFTGDGVFSRVAIYNLQAPKGTPIDLGFRVGSLVYGHIYAVLDPEKKYAIKAISPQISSLSAVRSVKFTMWGIPADPRHDILRGRQPISWNETGFPDEIDGPEFGAAFQDAPIKPFFTLPMDCAGNPGNLQLRADSWAAPGEFTPTLQAENKLTVAGCDDPRIRFEPELSIQPTTRDASQPTGLDIHLEVPQRDQTMSSRSQISNLYPGDNLHAVDTPPVKKVVVEMPEGMTLSSSAAQGLGSCSPAQIGIGNNDPVTCPDSSQYGKLTLHTPLLPPDEPMEGFIYIAQQNQNPFNNFLSMYFVIEDPERGLRVKIPGKIDLDSVSGRITTTFDDLPQFPVADIQLTFKSGVRSALVNPATCGRKTIKATFYSWHDLATPYTEQSSYDVTRKADGTSCVNRLSERPFKAQMSAGTVNPNAGSYSPFVFRMTRSDDDQELSQIGVEMPGGLTARLAGVSRCSDDAILQASVPSRTGAEEAAGPSCPASSQIGTTDVGSGVGVPLTFIPGKVYLAGPYHGSPLSMVVVTPILAGPYDLGVIVVRSGIAVDPVTTEIDVQTDPFPQIYQGIPVRIRDIRLAVNRPNMIRNPTNCSPKQIQAHLTGAGGDVNSTADDTATRLTENFQVGNCAALGFKPQLSLSLKGGTNRGDHPSLRAVLRARSGDANIDRVSVALPRSAFLDQSHINTICTRVQFAADNCPPGAVYGQARAWTPLLDEPLEGPVYLRSSNNELPDMVIALKGLVDIELVGRIDSIRGGIRSTFETVPDQPVSKFVLTMKGGGKGLLQNSDNICEAANRATVLIDGQNGKAADQRPLLKNAKCTKLARKAKRAARAARRAGR